MAVDVADVYSVIGMTSSSSPSFSFSKDNSPINDNGYRLDHHSLVDFDFAFNVDSTVSFQSSTADELFSDGKILPATNKDIIQLQKVVVKQEEEDAVLAVAAKVVPSCSSFDPQSSNKTTIIKKSLKEFLLEDEDEDEDEEEAAVVVVAKPFWKFRRSNSLNYCDNRNQNNKKGGLIRGSWKILFRSGSTGKFLEKILEEEEEEKSTKNSRFFRKFSRSNSLTTTVNVCDHNNNNSSNAGNNNNNNNKGPNISVDSLRRSSSSNEYHHVRKSLDPKPKPLRRSNSTGSAPGTGSHHNHYVRNKKQQEKVKVKNVKPHDFGSYYSNSNNNGKNIISPVLNLPSPYISRVISVDLFGVGSLFCNSSTKDRKKRK